MSEVYEEVLQIVSAQVCMNRTAIAFHVTGGFHLEPLLTTVNMHGFSSAGN